MAAVPGSHPTPGQHPHPPHGRNWPSINTLAAYHLGIQPHIPRLGLRGAVRHSEGLLSLFPLTRSCFKSWGQPRLCSIISPCPALWVPVRDEKWLLVHHLLFCPMQCTLAGSRLSPAGGCWAKTLRGWSALDNPPHPYTAAGALPEADRHHPSCSSLPSLPVCLHVTPQPLPSGNLCSPISCLVAPDLVLAFSALRRN